MLQNIDSLIFDMDGTLWDNVNSYVKVWNTALDEQGYKKQVTREDLLGLMGMEPRGLLNAIIPEADEAAQDYLFTCVTKAYGEYVPHMQPKVFPGVIEGLEKLSKKYKLFLLSNCEKNGLVNFMNHTKTGQYITDYREFGQNSQPKHINMQDLVTQYKLQAAVYIGDTASDGIQTRLAGLPFVFVEYGFGKSEQFDLKFSNFTDLTDYFMQK